MNKYKFTYGDKIIYIIGWLIAVAMLTVYIISKVLGHAPSLPACLFHTITGYYCPGCGGSRAILAFFHGYLISAFCYHPVVAVFFVGYFVYMFLTSLHLLSKGRTLLIHARPIYLWILLILTISNCLVRNLVLAIWGIHLL